jgi:two-component system cell cycle sensor histidine kinase/response regulator CckA
MPGEERYRRLVNRLPDAILRQGGGKCVFANAAAARLFGAASPKEMLGPEVLDLPHPDLREFIQQRIRLAYGGGHEKLQEIKILRLVGHPVDVEIMALAITHQGPPAIQVVLRDMTCRKLAKEAVRQGQEHLRQAAGLGEFS